MVREAQVERTAFDRGKADVAPTYYRLLRTAIGWGISWGLGWSICLTPIFAYSILLFPNVATLSDVQWLFAISIAVAVIVSSGVLLTSRRLRQTMPSVRWRQDLGVAISWSISLTIGGAIPWFVLLFFVPIEAVVAWTVAMVVWGGALMFWQLGRLHPSPKALLRRAPGELRLVRWVCGRAAVLLLLLIGFSGPWTSCAPCFMCSSEETFTGFQLIWHFPTIMALFFGPVLFLFAFTLFRLLWNSAVVMWLERFSAAASLLIIGLQKPWEETWFWGYWVTTAAVLLALFNQVGEWILARKRRP